MSIAGKREGIGEGTRSGLVFEALKVVKYFQPDIFIAENVKGLLSHNNGDSFKIILEEMSSCGYAVDFEIINTKEWLPQNRDRIFIIGIRLDLCEKMETGLYVRKTDRKREVFNKMLRESKYQLDLFRHTQLEKYDNYSDIRRNLRTGSRPKLFPIRNSNKKISEKRHWKSDYAGCISTTSSAPKCNFDGSTTLIVNYRHGDGLQKRQGFKDDIRVKALTERRTEEAKGIRRKYIQAGRDFSPRRGKEITTRNDNNSNTITATQSIEQAIIISKPNGFNNGSEQPVILRAADQRINVKMTEKKISPSITATNCAKRSDQEPLVMKNGKYEKTIRRLTSVETERLQGFPDNWTKYGSDGEIISDTQRYKMCWNAVSVPVVKAIGERLT